MKLTDTKETALDVIHKIVLTIFVSLIDQLGYLLIEVFFYQTRFVKASQMFHYSLTYYSFFNLISVIIVPNLALKQAFTDFRLTTTTLSAAALNHKYNSVIFSNYVKLVFSALNFKLIKPFLTKSLLQKRHQRTGQNSNIIFGISFLITSTFYACLYFWDRILFSKMRTKPGQVKAEKLQSAKDEIRGLPILKRYDLVKLPVTIFFTALNILVVGTLIVSCFGYYGIGFEIDQTQQEKQSFFGKIKSFFTPSNSSGESSTKRTFFSYLELVFSGKIFEKPQNIEIKPSTFRIFWNILTQLFADRLLLAILLVYLVYVAIFISLNNNDAVINRVQKLIWKRQKKVENVNFEGKSFREANPAYEILDTIPSNSESEVKV